MIQCKVPDPRQITENEEADKVAKQTIGILAMATIKLLI